jgi:hypothetical protein
LFSLPTPLGVSGVIVAVIIVLDAKFSFDCFLICSFICCIETGVINDEFKLIDNGERKTDLADDVDFNDEVLPVELSSDFEPRSLALVNVRFDLLSSFSSSSDSFSSICFILSGVFMSSIISSAPVPV